MKTEKHNATENQINKNLIEVVNNEIKLIKCPEIIVKIGEIEVNSLLDTGSEISCISEEYYLKIKDKLKECSILPVTGKIIKGAVGATSSMIKNQIFLTLNIGNIEKKQIFLIIPKLIRDCIIGIDVLYEFHMIIDIYKETITFSDENGNKSIKFNIKEFKSDEMMHRKICNLQIDEIYEEFDAEIDEKIPILPTDNTKNYNLTVKEISNKLNSCKADKNIIKNL